jgi:hypothetical protein
MEKKDNRMKLLKNVLENLKYIKIRGWENIYFAKITEKR